MKLHHIALSVIDLKAMTDGYHKALGLVPGFAFELPGFQVVMAESPNGFRIEFFQAENAQRTVDSSTPLTVMRFHGFTHLAMNVESVTAEYDRLLAIGAESVWNPRRSPEPGQDMAFVRDPEGNLIELIGPSFPDVGVADGH